MLDAGEGCDDGNNRDGDCCSSLCEVLAAGSTCDDGRFQQANDYFRDAVAQAPTDVTANTEWGALFLEKHNRTDAAKSFQAARRR